jgi:hypothetical protein
MVLYQPIAPKFYKNPTFRMESPLDFDFRFYYAVDTSFVLSPSYDVACHWGFKYHCSNCLAPRVDGEAVETAWAICDDDTSVLDFKSALRKRDYRGTKISMCGS